jgi:hypothetical protein
MIPQWFLTYDVALDFVFGLITLLVAYYCFRIVRVFQHRELLLFGTGFFLLSIFYLIDGLSHIVFLQLSNNGFLQLNFDKFGFSFLFPYILLTLLLTGLVTIYYSLTKIHNTRTYCLLLVLAVLGMVLSVNQGQIVYIISAVLFGFITSYYFSELKKEVNGTRFIMFISFLMLTIANFNLIFSNESYAAYILDHILSLFAYGLITLNLARVLRNGKKTK